MATGLVRSGAIYGIANVLAAGVPFLLLPVLTRALPPADYGMVVSFFMLASLCSSLAGLSVHGAVAVKWFERQGQDFPHLVAAALLVALASTAACAALLLVASGLFGERLDLPPRLWLLAAVHAGAATLVAIRSALWQSQGRALASASLQVGSASLNVAFSLAGVFVFALGGEGRIFGATAANLVCATAAVALLLRGGDARWAAARGADVKSLLRFGVPLLPHALAGAWMTSADRFAVAALLGQDALGIYGTAAQLGMAMAVLGDALVKAASPWMYAQLALKTPRARLRVVGATWLLAPLWLVVALLLWGLFKAAAPLIVGERYLAAIDLSLWMLLAGAVSATYLGIAGLFFFTARTEWISLATVATALAATALAPALASSFGLVGAALALLGAQSLSLALTWALSTRIAPMPWHRPRLAARVLARSWRTAR